MLKNKKKKYNNKIKKLKNKTNLKLLIIYYI